MREEIESNLAEPMSEEEMAGFVLEEHEKHYPRDKNLKALRALLEGRAGDDEGE